MRTLRGGNAKIDSNKNSETDEKASKSKETEKVIDDDDDDDVGANGDETTDDEGGVDTPPPPPEEDEDSKEEKIEVEEKATKEKITKEKTTKEKASKEKASKEKATKEKATKEKASKEKKNKKEKANETEKSNKKEEKAEENDKVKEEPEGEYEVEQIVDMEVQKRKKCPVSFRVRWQGFTEKDDTWLPASQLSCDDLVQDFLEISGRKPEYERAFESRKRSADSNNENCRQSSRKAARISYSELDEDQEEILPSGTRSRKIKTKAEKKQMPVLSSKKKAKKDDPTEEEEEQPRPQEHFEVEKIVDHRVKGRFTDYKIRWKGFGSKEDVWLPEGDLNCPTLIKAYNKSVHAKPKPEENYEVESIAGMREVKGRTEYKVRWKNWGPKYDSWLPEDELSCKDILERFKTTLEKLEKQTDWQVEKIMDTRERKGKKEFLIHWQGFDPKCDTWEPEDNLEGCKDILEKYVKDKEKAKEKLLKSGRKTREDRPRPERYVENFTGGSRARSKRKSASTSYSEFYDE